MQWFLTYDEAGVERPSPYRNDLTGQRGLDLAVYALQWCGENFPGWEPLKGKKADRLVSIN
jgi:hypothetical protein